MCIRYIAPASHGDARSEFYGWERCENRALAPIPRDRTYIRRVRTAQDHVQNPKWSRDMSTLTSQNGTPHARGGNGSLQTYPFLVSGHAEKFCLRALVGGAGSDTRRPRCPLRPRGCGCTGGSSEFCEGRIAIRPALHRCGQHMTLKKHLVAAAAIPAASSVVSSI